MMKILQINCVYNTGSTGKIVKDIHTQLQNRGIESVVCYGRGVKVNEPHIYKICSELYAKINNLLSRITGLMYGGCCFSTKRLISVIKKENPDIVHLHCINGYFVNIYRLITWLKEHKIKTVLTLHAEFMHTGNCAYALDCDQWKTGCENCPRLKKETKAFFLDRTHTSWIKMMYAFKGYREDLIIVSVSPWLMNRAKQSPILEDKQHVVVLNGIDTEVFHPYETSNLRAKHGIKDNEKVIFHATAGFSSDPNHIKGGYYVLKLAGMLRSENVRVFVAGTFDASIQAPDNLIFLGPINDRNLLAKYYSMADVTLLTSRKESFSMICAESLCCGTPVVGFKAGAPEQIAIPEYSRFIDFGNVGKLKSALEEVLARSYDLNIIYKKAKDLYSMNVMVKKYQGIHHELMR